MKLLWIALIAVLLAGCAVVPAPYPSASVQGYGPSVAVGVPVYAYPYYGHPYYVRHYYPYRHF